MSLEELSDFEVQAFNKIGIPDFLVKDSEGPSYYKPAVPDDEYSRNKRPEDPRPDPKHTSEYRDHARCFEAISGLCTFARVLESVDYISMLATRASSINRRMSRGNFEELEILCRRAKWHSRLLSVVSEELLHRSTHIDSIIRLVEDFISESLRVYQASAIAITRYATKHAVWNFIKRSNHKAVLRAIEELESLKPNLILIIQLLQK